MKSNKKMIGAAAATVFTGLVVYAGILLFAKDRGITPPLSGLDMPATKKEFSAEKGLSYHHPTGSNIKVPANAFSYADGTPATGNVTLTYRELHDPIQTLLSGIPMELDGGGYLQSAGMMEVRAEQNGQPLQLMGGKELQVDLAGYRDGRDYSLYYLDGDESWEVMGQTDPDTNRSRQTGLKRVDSLDVAPQNPEPGPDEVVVELDTDFSKNKDLAVLKDARWRMTEPEKFDSEKDGWVFRVKWERVEIEPVIGESNVYELQLRNIADRTARKTWGERVPRRYSCRVTPVLTGKKMKKAMRAFQRNMKDYLVLKKELDKERDRLEQEADLLYSFSLNKMGVYNIDIKVNDNTLVYITGKFDFAGFLTGVLSDIKVMTVNQDINSVFIFQKKDWNKMFVQPGTNTSVVAVLPNGLVGITSPEAFKKMKFVPGGTTYFKMDIYPPDDHSWMEVIGLDPKKGPPMALN